MIRLRTIGKQASMLLIGKIILQISNLFIILLLARFLGPNDYGIFSLASTLLIMMYTFFNLGIEPAAVYYISSYNKKNNAVMVKRIANTVLIIKLITSIISSILFYFLSDFLEASYNIQGLSLICKILSFGLFGYSIIYFMPSIFQAFNKFKESSLNEVLFSIIKIVLMGLFINKGLIAVSYSFSSALIISSIISLFMIYKVIPKTKERGFAFGKILKYSLISYIGGISLFVINYIGNLLIGSAPLEVSYLSIGNKIGMFITLPATTIGMSLFPNFSGSNKDKIREVFSLITKYMLLITSFLSFYIFSCGTELFNFVLGEKYINAIPTVNILMLGFFLYSIIIPLQTLFNSIKKPGIVSISLIIQALINLILAIIFTGALKSIGAAIAFLGSNIITSIFLILIAFKEKFKYDLIYLFKIMISLSITVLFTSYINGLIIKTIVYTASFIILNLLFKTINNYDINIFKKALIKVSKRFF